MVDDRVRGRLADLSQRLSDADWLDGDFSVGDLMMASVLRPLRRSAIVHEFAHLGAYVDRGEARPAFQRAHQAQLATFPGKTPEGLDLPAQAPAPSSAVPPHPPASRWRSPGLRS